MFRFFIFTFIMLVTAHSSAMALESRFVSADYIQARLLGGTNGSGQQEKIPAGLEIRINDGWHAYWRMPGDGGLAPVLSWSGSENVEAVSVSWPAPARFETVGLYSFGYEKSVTLPLEVKVKEPGKPVKLNLQGDIMVCKDICVPQTVSLALDIPAGEATPAPAMKLLEEAASEVPHQGDVPGLRIDNFVAGPDAIVINAFSQAGYDDADLFIEAGDLYITAPPEIMPDKNDPRKAMLKIAAPEGIDNIAEYVGGRNVTLTLVNGNQAIEKTIYFQE